MRAPLRICSRRSVVAVLASGVVISMTALTGGIAPAFAKPGPRRSGHPGRPDQSSFRKHHRWLLEEQAPAEEPRAPKDPPSPPKIESPPQQATAPEIQAPAPQPEAPPAPQVQAPTPAPAPQPQPEPPAPEIQAPSAPKKDAPRVADAPKVNAPTLDAPKVDAPKADVPKVDAPAPLPAVDQPAKPADPKLDTEVPKNLAPGAATRCGCQRSGQEAAVGRRCGEEPGTDASDSSAVSKAAQRIAPAEPETLTAPEQDIQLAKQSKPIEVKPEPASKKDVDLLSSAIDLQSKTKLGPFESRFDAGSEFSVGDRDHEWDWDNKHWDKKVRQWDRNWIEYDEFYRPIIFNPFRAPVRIVYALANATRMLVIQPLARVVIDVAELAAYSFTAVVLGAANVVTDVANVAADVVNVAVGTIFGGGYVPGLGVPFVPRLRCCAMTTCPFRSGTRTRPTIRSGSDQIVDVGDDVQYGGRKVLLDGATPAWGQWTTSPTGERQFEVHRTQQYPGFGEPQEAPLPGDYRMQLASDESANIDRTQMYLMSAAGVVAGLGFGALGLAVFLGRRRRET